MSGSARRRKIGVVAVIVGLVLLSLTGCASGTRSMETTSRFLDLSDRPQSVPGVREVLAVDEVRRVQGDNFGEADRDEHTVRVEVTLEDDLSGPDAAAVAEAVLELLDPEIARLAPDAPPDRTSASFEMDASGIWVGTDWPATADGVGDALADAIALREAGATSVSLSVSEPQTSRPGQADVRAPKDALVAIATAARSRERPVDLSADRAWYRSLALPDPVATKLVVDTSERPSVTTVQLSAPYDPLIVLVDAAEGDRAIDDVDRWLASYDGYPARSGEPLAYVIEGTRGGKVEGRVGR